MRRHRPLLCELHSHTRWSDGTLTVRELVDAYGERGFDVLCITDHVVSADDPWRRREGERLPSVDEESWPPYLAEIDREAARARGMYGLLVIPGLELTLNDEDPLRAAHAVAIGLRDFVSVDDGITEAMTRAGEAGAALVAAHPNGDEPPARPGKLTRRFKHDPALRALAHRFELFNRNQFFGWVADEGLPAVACGDFHRREHLAGWKTLVPAPDDELAVVSYLRSPGPAHLTHIAPERGQLAA